MPTAAVVLALGASRPGLVLMAGAAGVDGLLPVANRPLLQHAIGAVRDAGVTEIVVATARSGAAAVRRAVADAGVRLLELPDGAGPLAAVLAARELLPDGPVVLHGDDVLVLDGLRPALERFRHDAPDALVLSVAQPARISARDHGRTTVALQPEPSITGVQVIGPAGFDAAEQLEALRGAAATLDDLPGAVRRAGGRVEEREVPAAWRFTGDPLSLLDASRMLLERILAGPLPPLPEDVQVYGRVVMDASARIRSSKLRGPVLIGAGARIQDSYVGPYTSIGAGVVLDGAEIEHSIVLPGAEVNHVGVRIEDSLIGAGARVQRTFAMPTAMRLYLGAGGRVALS